MTSIYSNSVERLIQEIEQIFISEFHLRTPFKYDDVLPGERYGLISFEEFDSDAELAAKDVFKVIKAEVLLTFGYDTESKARFSPVRTMMDLDNFAGLIKHQLTSNHNIFYDFRIEGSIPRALRQPLKGPDIWISDVTATAIVRIAIPNDVHGMHMEFR